MKFILEIDCDNAAFEPDAKREIARILRRAASKIDDNDSYQHLRDINGNKVGKWEIE